jgi:hypothetical protein
MFEHDKPFKVGGRELHLQIQVKENLGFGVFVTEKQKAKEAKLHKTRPNMQMHDRGKQGKRRQWQTL